MEKRKKDHIELAFKSQTFKDERDTRFRYEPLLEPHPEAAWPEFTFLGRKHKVPLWVSSMTGGTKLAAKINTNLARICREFGFGMGLGSCRIILKDNTHFEDFNMRHIIGPDLPLYANLGIAQIEELLAEDTLYLAIELVEKLQADGLVIHVNPMQEWFQPEGNRMQKKPIDTITEFLEQVNFKVIVKEVGQGMGYDSLKRLLELPLEAIEFGAFGGTNFAQVEMKRAKENNKDYLEPLTYVGEDAETMLNSVNHIVENNHQVACRQIIVSGGVKSFLDGYYFIKKSKLPAVYGMASTFLKYAKEDYDSLKDFVTHQVQALAMANAYLRVNS